MEVFWVLLALAFLALPFLGLAGFVMALGNRKETRRRLDSLEADLGGLRAAVRELRERLGTPPERPPLAPEAESAAPPPETEPEPEPLPVVAEAERPAAFTTEAPPSEPEPPPPPEPAREPVPESESEPTPAPSAPPAPTPPSLPEPPGVDWERWLGVRGAALLGGIVLALAGLLFFQYSIQKGWISPAVRVVLGTVTGVGLLVGSEGLRRRDYVSVANAVAGGSVVVLYAAFWAAGVHYRLVPMALAWGLMALVTVVAGLLAVKRDALVVAVLGLVGGFATPLLLGQGEDRPVGLFGYLLLLDLGLFAVARRRRWPSLALLALLGTLGLEGLWASRHFEPERILLAVGVLAAFVVVFLWSGLPAGDAESRRAVFATRAGAILLPFAFAVYFATRVDLGERLLPVVGLLLLLAGAASWVARREGVPWLRTGAAVGCVAVLAVWLAQGPPETPTNAWIFAGSVLAIAALFHVGLELAPRPEDDPLPAAVVGFVGLALLTLGLGEWRVALWPSIATFVGLAAGWARQALRGHRPRWLMAGAALVAAGGPASLHLRHGRDAAFRDPWLFLAVLVALAAAGLGMALARDRGRELAGHGTALYGVATLFFLGVSPIWRSGSSTGLGLGAATLLLVAVLAAAALAGDGRWTVASALAAAVLPYAWVDRSLTLPALTAGAIAVALHLGAPYMTPRLGADRWAWRGAAVAGPAVTLALIEAWRREWGADAIGTLPVLLGAATLAALAGARRRAPDDGTRRVAIVWLAAVALGFVSLAIPLQLDRQWITIGWALEALGVILLWRRLDHPGLKYLGVALALAVSARLLLNPYVLEYGEAGGWPVLNWLLYTYLVPAVAIGAMAALLRPLERDRLRIWERRSMPGEAALAAGLLGLLAVALGFAWINLTVMDAFAEGPRLQIALARRPARDLTLSIAWIAYAVGLLVAGVWKGRTALRWVSLGFLMLAIAKVFLYDLGELEDLYRVLSLVGLAVSLILVSLLYQRFVFRDRERKRSDP